MWSILEEVGGGKMPCRIIVWIENNYLNDKKYSGPIVVDDYVEKTLFEVIKPRNLPKIGAQHYTLNFRPLREKLVPCKERYVINDPLVDRDRILFPPLHIKFGLIKQVTKAQDKDGDCFTYLCQAFPG